MWPYRQTSRRPTKCRLGLSIPSVRPNAQFTKVIKPFEINYDLLVVYSREGDSAIPTDLTQTDKMRLDLSINSERPIAHLAKVVKLFSNKCRSACDLFKRRGCGNSDRPRADRQNAAWASQSILSGQSLILLKS